jgi:hypothetical protein
MHDKMINVFTFALVLGVVLACMTQAELVGWWRFDEGNGTTAYDSSGNGNDGTLIGGATWVAGRFGGGIELDGTSGYISVPDFELTTNSITFAIWLNGWKGGDWAPFISSRVVGQCEMIFGNDDTLRYVWNNDSSATWGWTGGPVIPEDTWTMLAVTIDPDRAVAYVYTDAGGLTSMTNEIPHIEETVGALQIGWSYGDRFVRGIIDEAAVYDHALTQDEIMTFVKGEGIPHAINPKPSDGSILMDTWVSLSWRAGDYAVSHDVYLGDDFDAVNEATRDSAEFRGNQDLTYYVAGFPGYAYPDGLVPGTTYYWRIDEVNEANPESPWKGDVWRFSIPPKTAYSPNPADGIEVTDPNSVMLNWTAGFGAILHTVYFGDDYDEVNNATVGVTTSTASYSPGPLEREQVYFWRVDEFDAFATYQGDVWCFTTPGAVGSPQPAYDATDVALNATLSWAPADSAASHQLYFGTDKEVVRNADTGAPEYKGSIALDAESYAPGLLDAETTYYWRVDEVDAQGNVSTGPLWLFTTGTYLLVDDFESYTDNDADGEAIWQTWVDGYGIADNGAQVGNLMPPYCELTIVHGGAQSMPLFYVNEAGVTNSEAVLPLSATGGPRDWTQAGVADLSLWVRGASGNAAEPLYVSVSNSAGAPAIVANDDPDAATVQTWTQWIIPLQAFADQGINLSNLDKIAIGLGTTGNAAAAGGSGTLYIDDIRLYQL